MHNKTAETFTIEGWESVIPPLPEKMAGLARNVTHGELNSLLQEFCKVPLTAGLVSRILEAYVIFERTHEYNELLKVKHTSQRGGAL